MRKGIKKLTAVFAVLALCTALLCGCAEQISPEEITITLNGKKITSVDITDGEELSGLTAVLSPSGSEGNILWSSDDSGVVKVTASRGEKCTLAAKNSGSAKITASCGNIYAVITVYVQKDMDNLSERDIALSVKDVDYPSEWCNLFFADMYYRFIRDNSPYLSYYGIDTSGGIGSLKDQACDYSEDGTWYGYFRDSTVQIIQQVRALCDYAAEAGLSLDDEDMEMIDSQVEEMHAAASQYGYADINEYLEVFYGSGVNEALYREYLEQYALSNKGYYHYTDNLSFTDEEIRGHYLEMGYEEGENNYRLTSMRHVLIMAEQDENGEYTEEAIAAAHETAEKLYGKWRYGEQTEESFAELANTYSEDRGSNTGGGLYENIFKGQMVDGINTWLFDEERAVGDTAVIDNNGSYVGTHIVFFAGYGEVYSVKISRDDLASKAVNEWFDRLDAEYAVKRGEDFDSIGIF